MKKTLSHFSGNTEVSYLWKFLFWSLKRRVKGSYFTCFQCRANKLNQLHTHAHTHARTHTPRGRHNLRLSIKNPCPENLSPRYPTTCSNWNWARSIWPWQRSSTFHTKICLMFPTTKPSSFGRENLTRNLAGPADWPRGESQPKSLHARDLGHFPHNVGLASECKVRPLDILQRQVLAY